MGAARARFMISLLTHCTTTYSHITRHLVGSSIAHLDRTRYEHTTVMQTCMQDSRPCLPFKQYTTISQCPGDNKKCTAAVSLCSLTDGRAFEASKVLFFPQLSHSFPTKIPARFPGQFCFLCGPPLPRPTLSVLRVALGSRTPVWLPAPSGIRWGL